VRLSIVTAVSRPEHLSKVRMSIDRSLEGAGIDLRWILVFDTPELAQAAAPALEGTQGRFVATLEGGSGGPSRFGIAQKNLGISLVDDGFYHCLDDDNLVHPDFFAGIGRAARENPGKRAFAFNQRRWDSMGNFTARPETMVPYKIDNTMFVVHRSLIGDDRYDPALAGSEDGHFFQSLYAKDPSTWVFIDRQLAYYNLLRHFPDGVVPEDQR